MIINERIIYFNMLHILQLPGTLSRSNGRMTVVMNAYRELVKHDIQFDFLVTSVTKNDYTEEIKSLGGKIFTISKDEDTLRAVRQKMKHVVNQSKYRYDAVHYHAISSWGFALDIPYRENIRVITHSHATRLSDTWFKSVRNRIFTLNIFLYSDQFIACSNEAGKKLFMGRNFVYLPNAINPTQFFYSENNRKKYRNIMQIKNNELVIGNVGRLAKQKNQQFLIKVLNYLVKLGIPAKLLIVGDGINKQNIVNRASELGLINNIILVGAVNNPSEYYSAMDVFALPSVFEGLPMVGVEAQANGLPAIFSSSISRQINVYDAQFVDIKEKDIETWAKKIIILWKQGRDKTAPQHIENSHFNISTVFNDWKHLYLK